VRTITIKDVARRAQVSVATVSRVLNGTGQVGDTLRKKVELAIHELDYLPNSQARALASNEFHTIAAIIPTIRNINFVVFLRALQDVFTRERYTLLFSAHNYDRRAELREAQALFARGVDGVVLVGQDHEPELLAALDQRRLPYVTTWTMNSDIQADCIGVRNEQAAARLTRYLLDIGHREFALVATMQPTNDRNRERARGFERELAKEGIVLPASRVKGGTGTIDEGKKAVLELLAAPRPPTAIICINDFLAFGALLQCQALGIDVPGQVSISGFGDIQFASALTPSLTTVRMPAAEIGRLAGEHLLRKVRMRKGETYEFRPIQLEAPLIVRESTGRPSGPRRRRRAAND